MLGGGEGKKMMMMMLGHQEIDSTGLSNTQKVRQEIQEEVMKVCKKKHST
jgi:hypothetical protein